MRKCLCSQLKSKIIKEVFICNKILLYTYHNGYNEKDQTLSAGEDMDQLEISYTANVGTKWYTTREKLYGTFF